VFENNMLGSLQKRKQQQQQKQHQGTTTSTITDTLTTGIQDCVVSYVRQHNRFYEGLGHLTSTFLKA
jgi:hypothetical protein